MSGWVKMNIGPAPTKGKWVKVEMGRNLSPYYYQYCYDNYKVVLEMQNADGLYTVELCTLDDDKIMRQSFKAPERMGIGEIKEYSIALVKVYVESQATHWADMLKEIKGE